MKKLKLILIFSFLLNIVAVAFAIRRYYYFQQERNHPPKVIYPLPLQKVYDPLPIDSTDIVFVGDSYILFFNFEELLPSIKIKNRGIGSDRILGVISRIASIAKGHPRKIFIEIGSNDLSAEIPVDTCIYRMTKVINIIKRLSPKTEIYIQSVIPRTPNVPVYNSKLQAVCKANSITYLDIYSLFQENNALSKKYAVGDDIHINGQAYLLWSKFLKPYL